jgi:hypothetical protein
MSFIAVAAGAAIIGLIGTGVSVAGSLAAGKTQKSFADYNAAVLRNKAAEEEHKASILAERKRAEGATLMARQRVLYAKSGVGLGGTPTDVIIGTAGDIEEDAQTILQKGKMASEQDLSSAELSEMEGEGAESASHYQAGGTLLTGLGSAIGMASRGYTPKRKLGGGGGDIPVDNGPGSGSYNNK